jgi:4-diphosphocytidyl-2-C-methyl-D-erythritol kinase
MIVFPNAKINLGLQITEKLPNGYHSINSCLYPIPWSDILEVIPGKKVAFNATGIEIPGKKEDDIVLKAYKLLRKDFSLPKVNIHLHKMIPIGAGLGGGSSDAAFMLKHLNNEAQLFLEESVLEDYAAQIGSDCPFFINNKPATVSGTGTELEPIELNLTGMALVVINPGIHVSTSQAYAGVVPKKSTTDLRELLTSKDFARWQKELINDFEPGLFEQYPELPLIKELLYQNGAAYAAMSGSGSTMFGLFENKPSLTFEMAEHWVVKELIL